MRRVLITGINGYIGQYLYLSRPKHVHTEGSIRNADTEFGNFIDPLTSLHHFDLRLDIESQLKHINTDILIHTAAMANLGLCQKNPQLADQVNAQATMSIARWCRKNAVRFIYLSTDIVFDGEHPPFSENDNPNPVNVYGSSKLKGENAVQEYAENYAIIRIALGMGKGKFQRSNFVDWVINKINKAEQIPLYEDEFRTASPLPYLVNNIWRIALSEARGIFHQFGAKRLSRYEIGKLICKELNSGMELLRPVKAAELQDYPRPLDVSLTTDREIDGKKLILPGIDEVIKEIII